jgi:uncharacterized protein YdhG (YjbR/CyaY superfamily)
MAATAAAKLKTIDEYLSRLPADQRQALEKLRRLIRAAAPRAEECISYGVPSFRLDGMLVGFGAATRHCSLYLMSLTPVARYQKLLAGYDTSPGTIRFTPDRLLPATLVKKLVRVRIDENRQRQAQRDAKRDARRGVKRSAPRRAKDTGPRGAKGAGRRGAKGAATRQRVVR